MTDHIFAPPLKEKPKPEPKPRKKRDLCLIKRLLWFPVFLFWFTALPVKAYASIFGQPSTGGMVVYLIFLNLVYWKAALRR